MPKKISTKKEKKTAKPKAKPAVKGRKGGKKIESTPAVKQGRTQEAGKGPPAVVYGIDGKAKGKVTLPTELFAAPVNKTLLAQAVRVYLANQRVGTAATKTRGEVEGSTRKIYRQKGTGRARHGSIRAPIFVGGGIVFGPKPRDYSLKLPQKMKRQALASALTAQFLDGKIKVVDGLLSLPPKTREMVKALTSLESKPPLLLVIPPGSDTVVRAARNINWVEILPVNNLNPYVVLAYQTLVLMREALPVLKNTFMK